MRPKNGILLLSAAYVLALSGLASAQDTGMGSTRQSYQQDRAFCKSGQSSQDFATCMREAGAAAQERPRGNLTESNDANKFARCEYHKNPEDREYCIRRMQGEGTVSGSVDGGGLLRELRVVTKPGP
jgi:hypothetical protein